MSENADIVTYIRLIGSDYPQTSENNTKNQNDNMVDNIIPMNVGLTSSYIKNLISDLSTDKFDEDIILDQNNKRCRYIKIDLPFDQKLIYYFKEIMVNFFLGELSEESIIKKSTIKELMIKESKMKDSIRNNALMAVSENRDILEIARYMDVRSSRSELYELLLRVMADYIFDKYQNELHSDSDDETAVRIMKHIDEKKINKMIYPDWFTIIMMKHGICDKDKYMLFAKKFIKKYIDTHTHKDVDIHKDVDTTIDELKKEYTDLFEEIEKCFSEIITYDSLPISVPNYEGNISSITRFKDKHFHPIRPTSIKYNLQSRLSIKNNKLYYEGVNILTDLFEKNPNIKIFMDVGGVEKISAGSIFIAAVSKGKLILGGTLSCMMNRSDPKTRSFFKIEDIQIDLKKNGKTVLTKINYFNKVDIIACGYSHIVLLADGEVYILGRFVCENGKYLFDNEAKDISEMNFQKLTFFSGKRVTKIECGPFNFTVIADGKLYVFGPNYCGSLGLDNINNNNWQDEFFTPDYSNIPCLDFGEKRVTDVSSNISHTAILVDGELYTVGKNKSGELGFDKELKIGVLFQDDDESKGRYQPVPMKVNFFRGKNITHISCGTKHTSVVADNKLYVFGKINIQPEYIVQDEENMGNIFRVILKDPTKKIVDLSSGTGKTSIIVR